MFTTETELHTVQDFRRLQDAQGPESLDRFELIAGEIIMVPPPSTFHQDLLLTLASELRAAVLPRKLGKVFVSPVNIYATNHDAYQPDILFVARERLSIVKADGVHGSPDLVIEILSPSNAYYDLKHKKNIYEQIGVKEDWIVDPMEHTIDSFVNGPNGCSQIFSEVRSGRIHAASIPEFSVEVSELFEAPM